MGEVRGFKIAQKAKDADPWVLLCDSEADRDVGIAAGPPQAIRAC